MMSSRANPATPRTLADDPALLPVCNMLLARFGDADPAHRFQLTDTVEAVLARLYRTVAAQKGSGAAAMEELLEIKKDLEGRVAKGEDPGVPALDMVLRECQEKLWEEEQAERRALVAEMQDPTTGIATILRWWGLQDE